MDALRAQVVALTEELTTVKSELINVKSAHANLHQQSSDANTAAARSFAENRSRVEALETQISSMATGHGGPGKKPLIKPEQVVVGEFSGAMTDGRSRFLEWCEKIQDRVELYEEGLAKAMAEAEKKDSEISSEESTQMGISPMVSRQLHGFLKDKTA